MAVETSPSWAIMNRVGDTVVAAHLARDVSMRFLMSAFEYCGAAALSVDERAALLARSPFEAERLALDIAFGRRDRLTLMSDLDDASKRRLGICRMLESFRAAKANNLTSAAVSSLD